MKKKIIRNNGLYWDFIRELRNTLTVKRGFIQQHEISAKEHYNFMERYGLNYFICILEEKPVGYVGVINNDIRVATHPDYQGKGIAKFMINEVMEKYPAAFAKVKLDNEASIKLFESCGFEKKYYILERSSSSILRNKRK